VDWQEIIDGVQDLDITYVGASGTTGWNTDDTLHNELPVAVRVKLTLVDQQIQELALPANVKQDRLKGSERVFVKAFFLPRKQF
jgi:spore maturation protein CgeB